MATLAGASFMRPAVFSGSSPCVRASLIVYGDADFSEIVLPEGGSFSLVRCKAGHVQGPKLERGGSYGLFYCTPGGIQLRGNVTSLFVDGNVPQVVSACRGIESIRSATLIGGKKETLDLGLLGGFASLRTLRTSNLGIEAVRGGLEGIMPQLSSLYGSFSSRESFLVAKEHWADAEVLDL